MGDLVDLEEQRVKRGHKRVEKMACVACGHMWVGVFPLSVDEESLECSRCGEQDSRVVS